MITIKGNGTGGYTHRVRDEILTVGPPCSVTCSSSLPLSRRRRHWALNASTALCSLYGATEKRRSELCIYGHLWESEHWMQRRKWNQMVIITIQLERKRSLYPWFPSCEASIKQHRSNEIAHSNRTIHDMLLCREQLQVFCAHHIRFAGVARERVGLTTCGGSRRNRQSSLEGPSTCRSSLSSSEKPSHITNAGIRIRGDEETKKRFMPTQNSQRCKCNELLLEWRESMFNYRVRGVVVEESVAV